MKIAETSLAVANGADEIDIVLNLGYFFDHDYESLCDEIAEQKEATRDGSATRGSRRSRMQSSHRSLPALCAPQPRNWDIRIWRPRWAAKGIFRRSCSQPKEATRDGRLKVILETGALRTARNIKMASILSLYSGADFLNPYFHDSP